MKHLAVQRVHWLTPFLAGAALAGLMAAGGIALVATLPRPSANDALVVRVVAALERVRSVRSDQALSWLPSVEAACMSRRGGDTAVLSDGRTLAVSGARVRRTHGRWLRPLLIDAVARLAGCPRLLVGGLSTRLLADKQVVAPGMYRGRRAYWLRVDDQPPEVMLVVSRIGLKPLAVQFRTPRLHGRSRLFDVDLARIATSSPA
jgi:hypothetical protein